MRRHQTKLVIVGAGPAGLSAAAHARELGIEYVVLERAEHPSDTVHCYQARKPVMAEPGLVPRRSELPFEAGGREEVLGAWEKTVRDLELDVRLNQEVTAVEPQADGFLVRTAAGEEWQAERVVVAIGTRGNPRKLGVPGEELPHVRSRLVDPAEHQDQDILVVGAGDSALEVAIALAADNRVSLLVRKPTIDRAKEVLEREVLGLEATGQMKICFSTSIQAIREGEADLKMAEEDVTVPADLIFVQIGAAPPRKLLEAWGVEFTGEERDAKPRLNERYETTVPGLFLIGAAGGRDLIKLAINQGYEAVEYALGRECDPADEEVLCTRLPRWQGKAAERIEQIRQQIPLLGAADPLQLREVFLSAEVKPYRDGDVIFRQNDYTNTLMVVADGRVVLSTEPEGGGPAKEVAELTAGSFFGEMSLLSNRRRNATVRARGPVSLIEVPRKAMLKLLAAAPGVRDLVDAAFLIRALQKYLFPGVPEDLLQELAGRAELLQLDRDSEVFREGDAGDALYLIRSGKVKISKESGGREIVVSYLMGGNTFGETALLDGARRTASVSTIFPSELIRLSKEACDAFLAEHPEHRGRLVDTLERRRIDSLIAEATPRAGDVLTDMIEHEVVMATDALIIDEHKCVRCHNCVAACEGVHDDGQARLSLTGITFRNVLVPNSCWQCENPLCMLDCPPDAIVRSPRGEVYIKSNCIGCGNCERNCPYDNIFMVHPQPRQTPFGWLKRLMGAGEAQVEREVAVKCDLCSGLAGGPACVRSCPTGAAIRLDPHGYQQTIEELVVMRGEA